jgi:hypothetical protein
MALHTYTPTEWKNAPDHKTTPLNANNLNNIETGIENAYTDIATINSAVGDKADMDDLASITESGATADQAISAGTFFYLNGALVRAKTDIANGATFTLNTNYETVTAGALNCFGGVSLLWTNPDSSQNFAAQTVLIDLSAYKGVIVETIINSSKPITGLAMVGSGSQIINVSVYNNRMISAYRYFNVTSSGVVFTNCLKGQQTSAGSQFSESTDNTILKPTRIFGIK